MGTTIENKDLAASLFGKTKRSLLALFFSRPDESYYLRQAARLSGSGQGAVQRELKTLSDSGILNRRAQGRQVYYQANPDSPIFNELKALMLKSAGLRDIIVAAVFPFSDRVPVSFIFGSQARGEGTGASDVDLLVVGDIDSAQMVSALLPAQKKLGREINPVIYPEAEFKKKADGKGHFLSRVIKGPKIFIIGDEHELERLAK